MDVIISGRVTTILPVQQGVSQKTGQPWQSMEFVLCHEEGQYPRSVCLRIFGQDKIQQANIQMNEYITVHVNVDARQASGGRWFNSLDVWKVERQTQGTQQAAPQYQPAQPQYQQPAPQQFPPQVNQQGQPQYQPAPAPQPAQQPAPQAAPQQGPTQTGLPF